MKYLSFKGMVATSLLALSTIALGQPDSCHDVLLANLSDTAMEQSNQQGSLATAHARCASGKTDYKNDPTHEGRAGYGDFSINYSDTASSAGGSATQDCGSDTEDQHFQAALYYAQQSNAAVVKAWKACMEKSAPLVCTAVQGGDPTRLTIDAKWTLLSANPKVVRSEVRVGAQSNRPAFETGSSLQLGDNVLFVDRAAREPVTVDIQAGDGTASTYCHVFVPAVEVVRLADSRSIALKKAVWSDTPLAAMPPLAPGKCACVDPAETPLEIGGPFRPAPPDGTVVTYTNSCDVTLSLVGVIDTDPQSRTRPGIPLIAKAAGRKYFQSSIPKGGSLDITLDKVVSGGIFELNCPLKEFEAKKTLN